MDSATSSYLWLSLGENCLADDFLKRHGRKSFSTPFSPGRTNIDYALTLERERYESLLHPENLAYGDAWGVTVVRSTVITACDDIFDVGCSQGFEFTHHDPLKNEEHRQSYDRKVKRLLEMRGERNVVFLYHHRRNPKSDFPKLKEKLEAYRDIYSSGIARCVIVLFFQTSTEAGSDRRIEVRAAGDGIIECNFHTERMWSGTDPELFWGRVDDDLISEMFARVEEHLGQMQG